MDLVLHVLLNIRIVRLAVCLALAGFGVFAGVRGYWEVRTAPDHVVRMTLEEAAQRNPKDDIWVTLTQVDRARWDCESATEVTVEKKKWMTVVFTDGTGSILVALMTQDWSACESLVAAHPTELTGQLSRITAGRDYESFNDRGQLSRHQQAATLMKLCTFCIPNAPVYYFVVIFGVVAFGLSAVGFYYNLFVSKTPLFKPSF